MSRGYLDSTTWSNSLRAVLCSVAIVIFSTPIIRNMVEYILQPHLDCDSKPSLARSLIVVVVQAVNLPGFGKLTRRRASARGPGKMLLQKRKQSWITWSGLCTGIEV